MKKLQYWLFAVFASLLVCFNASATSVLDSATNTAITSGFTDLKDTILGLLTIAWPYLIAVAVIMMAPRIVSKLIKLIGSH